MTELEQFQKYIDGTTPRLPDKWYLIDASDKRNSFLFMKDSSILGLPGNAIEVEFRVDNGDLQISIRIKRVGTDENQQPTGITTGEYLINGRTNDVQPVGDPKDTLSPEQIDLIVSNLRASVKQANIF